MRNVCSKGLCFYVKRNEHTIAQSCLRMLLARLLAEPKLRKCPVSLSITHKLGRVSAVVR